MDSGAFFLLFVFQRDKINPDISIGQIVNI